jgi:hypothetical protein
MYPYGTCYSTGTCTRTITLILDPLLLVEQVTFSKFPVSIRELLKADKLSKGEEFRKEDFIMQEGADRRSGSGGEQGSTQHKGHA